ncbi:MAG: sensor histidine kinase [Trichodesmium sp.]
MDSYILPTLSEIFALEASNNDLPKQRIELARENPPPSSRETNKNLYLKAQNEWYSAIASINQLLENSLKISNSQDVRNLEMTETDAEIEINTISPVLNYKKSQTRSKYATSNTLFFPVKSFHGLVLSSPAPVLTNPNLSASFATSFFTHEISENLDWLSILKCHKLPLLPAAETINCLPNFIPISSLSTQDPITNEQFCLVLTAEFSLIMVLGKNSDNAPAFLFSFDPELVKKAWIVLRKRMALPISLTSTNIINQYLNFTPNFSHNLAILDQIFEQFLPVAPDYKIVMEFSRLLLDNLPTIHSKNEIVEVNFAENIKNENIKTNQETNKSLTSTIENIKSFDVELLKAIAHEVKTPLATIQTLTRLLLKRPHLNPEVIKKRLQIIDTECTAQIERFNLIFKAVELETQKSLQEKHSYLQLTTIPLAQIFQNSIPRWEQKATKRNHTLKVILPPKMPTVVSDPIMLDQVLGNMIENFSRNLPPGSLLQVEVMLAGSQLKLQLESNPNTEEKSYSPFTNSPKTPLKYIGHLLMFQPETGSLSLNLKVTKNLFEAMGGKLVVRQRPTKGEIMTIFLPVK